MFFLKTSKWVPWFVAVLGLAVATTPVIAQTASIETQFTTFSMGGHWNEISLSIPAEDGWVPSEIVNKPAGGRVRNGHYLAAFTNQSDEGSNTQPVLFVALRGVRCLDADCLVKIAEQDVEQMFVEVKWVETNRWLIPSLHMIAGIYIFNGVGSERTIELTYDAKSFGGEDMKVRAWVTGGGTQLVTFVYVAPVDQFDAHLNAAEEMIYAATVKHRQLP